MHTIVSFVNVVGRRIVSCLYPGSVEYVTRLENQLLLNKKCTQRAQTSADPEDLDFGLWTPGSEA